MVITGSAIFVEPGFDEQVLEDLNQYPHVTFHVKSDSGTELVVNLEAEDLHALEELCNRLKQEVPHVVDITHIYVNFEEEIQKIRDGTLDRTKLTKPKFFGEQ